MKQAVIGILAHVDAGKTTLAEAMLYDAGRIRALGRVDRGDAHLDTDAMERARGITIFSSQAELEHAGVRLMLVDSPGHVDFSAEAERTLAALDYALLVVGGNDGVQGHTETLWRLLARRGIPTFVFVNKTDLLPDGGSAEERARVIAQLRARLSEGCVPADDLAGEAAAMTDDAALDEYLEAGSLAPGTIRRLVAQRRAFPVFFGSALKNDGVEGLLDGLAELVEEREWPREFAARVYRVSHGRKGERVAWLKVTGGALCAKQVVSGVRAGEPWSQKVDQLRVAVGARLEPVGEVRAGRLCAVTGLTRVRPGDGLGAESDAEAPVLAPVLTYRVLTGDEDVHAVLAALRELACEDPMLGVAWSERLQEIHLQLMGAVQLEVMRGLLSDRYGLSVDFGSAGILYKETLSAPSMGIGHFEPLRHYAEAHLLVEPGPRGSGVVFGTRCSEDELDRNWQRLILANAMERDHVGVLTGAPLTDVRITLCAGRAHAKHTEGGDFRQATYRAVRQALMCARSRGECVLLEPWYAFELEVPEDKLGRAMSDMTRMGGRFGAPSAGAAPAASDAGAGAGASGGIATLAGEVPASELGDYALEVAAYTGGRGRLSLQLAGYEPCHDADRVIEEAAYDPEADLPNTPDSVFCSHGAGYTVKWQEVPAHAHVADDPSLLRPWRPADAVFFGGE